MKKVCNDEISVRSANKTDAPFIRYIFSFKEIQERCMLADEWMTNAESFIEYNQNSDSNWLWIIEDSRSQPVGMLMNYIRPAVNGIPALWSSYAILPKYRGKHYAELTLSTVPSIFQEIGINVPFQALLIANDNIASEMVAKHCGFEKIMSGGGIKGDRTTTDDALWLKG